MEVLIELFSHICHRYTLCDNICFRHSIGNTMRNKFFSFQSLCLLYFFSFFTYTTLIQLSNPYSVSIRAISKWCGYCCDESFQSMHNLNFVICRMNFFSVILLLRLFVRSFQSIFLYCCTSVANFLLFLPLLRNSSGSLHFHRFHEIAGNVIVATDGATS